MSLEIATRAWPRLLCLVSVLALGRAFAAPAPTSDSAAPSAAEAAAAAARADASAASVGANNTFTSKIPAEVEAEDGGAYGQLPVAKEILTPDTQTDLVYTITADPAHGRVGMSGGGDDEDFFKNKTSRIGYFAYRADDGFSGVDTFTYTVRNETTGLVYKNTVVVTVKPPPPVVMDKFEVGASRVQSSALAVALSTRPNMPVTRKVPSHEDTLTPADRIGLGASKVAYLLDDRAKPQNGTAKLDRATGQLTYAPNPGFIGEDTFKYYTIDENNPNVGLENTVSVKVEPIRIPKHIFVDRSKSREVDLVFVINNSPSMAAKQERIAATLGRFRQLFDAHDLDYRIGVLTTDFIDADPDLRPDQQHFYEEVRSIELDPSGKPVLDRRGHPKSTMKKVASNGLLVTLPEMKQPWVTPQTPGNIFSELVKVGTNGNSNRTAFTAVYNFVADYYHKQHTFLRPEAMTVVVFFMDEEETRMATWKPQKNGRPIAEWIENGKLPDLLKQYNARNPNAPQTLDGYINYWVLRPFIIAKGNKRGKLEIDAVVAPNNLSHRRAAELTGGSVLNIESDFSAPLAALGDRIADTVAVALDPVQPNATFYPKSLKVLVDGQEVKADPENGYIYDRLTHSIRFQGAAKKKAFLAKIDITYEEHM